jgi:hypothetical protein
MLYGAIKININNIRLEFAYGLSLLKRSFNENITKKPMKKLVVLAFMLIFAQSVTSQQNYTVNWGVASYDTLTGYIVLDPDEENNIYFGFEFPFFNDPFGYVTMDLDGYGYFEGSEDYNLLMFGGDFEMHEYSRLPIFSQWRYKSDFVNGLEVIKMEWRNVGISDDIWSSNPTDHRINYQVWFYENGIIEIHFGEIDLENTPFYNDTTGFIWSDGESYGPWLGISNLDITEMYYITGALDDINIITIEDSLDILLGVPEFGRYFRWIPDEVVGIHTNKRTENNDFIICKNPADDYIGIIFNNDSFLNSDLEIYSINGKLVKRQRIYKSHEQVDIRNLSKGIYLVKIIDKNSRLVSVKIIKK